MVNATLKKSAHVAVGIPVHLVGLVRDRFAAAQESIEELRGRLSDEAAAAFDAWVAEGERLVTMLGESVQDRREEAESTWEFGVGLARDIGRGLGATLTEPVVPVDVITGIGPAHAEELAKAGVVTTRALLERCRTPEATARLARQTGLGEQVLARWAASADLTRVKGIGHEHMNLLNAMGIGSLDQLARESAAELHGRARLVVDETAVVATVPSEESFAEWITAAADLTG